MAQTQPSPKNLDAQNILENIPQNILKSILQIWPKYPDRKMSLAILMRHIHDHHGIIAILLISIQFTLGVVFGRVWSILSWVSVSGLIATGEEIRRGWKFVFSLCFQNIKMTFNFKLVFYGMWCPILLSVWLTWLRTGDDLDFHYLEYFSSNWILKQNGFKSIKIPVLPCFLTWSLATPHLRKIGWNSVKSV